jgi:predicted NUDIX family NTP pyrophosphohydrolase
MPKLSAGLLVYRAAGLGVEVLLVHPGGPYWARRDDGAWSIPKGEVEPGDEPFPTALREFAEELGADPPAAAAAPLGEVRQAGSKWVVAWALEGDVDVSEIRSSTFAMEWPPRSGRTAEFPEVDRAGWFDLEAARAKLLAGQVPFLDRLAASVDVADGSDRRGG